MRRAISIVAALALGAGTPCALAHHAAPLPDRVMVRGAEYDLTLSKQQLRPGRAIVQFVNGGEDAHDLKLQRIGPDGAPTGPELAVGVVAPGEYQNLDTRLQPRSTYRLWCSLSDHAQRGMEATLQTTKKKKKRN